MQAQQSSQPQLLTAPIRTPYIDIDAPPLDEAGPPSSLIKDQGPQGYQKVTNLTPLLTSLGLLPKGGNTLQVIERGRVHQPNGHIYNTYEFRWHSPKTNTLLDIKDTVYWGQTLCFLKGDIDYKHRLTWDRACLIHGAKASYLNLRLSHMGDRPTPSLDETVICLSSNLFQYRHNHKGTIELIHDGLTSTRKRYKKVKLTNPPDSQTSFNHTGSIQNLLIDRPSLLSSFFYT